MNQSGVGWEWEWLAAAIGEDMELENVQLLCAALWWINTRLLPVTVVLWLCCCLKGRDALKKAVWASSAWLWKKCMERLHGCVAGLSWEEVRKSEFGEGLRTLAPAVGRVALGLLQVVCALVSLLVTPLSNTAMVLVLGTVLHVVMLLNGLHALLAKGNAEAVDAAEGDPAPTAPLHPADLGANPAQDPAQDRPQDPPQGQPQGQPQAPVPPMWVPPPGSMHVVYLREPAAFSAAAHGQHPVPAAFSAGAHGQPPAAGPVPVAADGGAGAAAGIPPGPDAGGAAAPAERTTGKRPRGTPAAPPRRVSSRPTKSVARAVDAHMRD